MYNTRMPRRITLREAVNRLADEGRDTFKVADLRDLLGLTPEQARHLAFRLARANLARRIRRGRYVLLPPAEWGERDTLGVNWYVAAAAMVEPDPYFLAYYTATTLHQMTQHPLRTVFVAVTKQRATVHVGPVQFRFVTLGERKFFGFAPFKVERGKAVEAADLERTFLDCVDRPNLCGGLDEVFRGFERRHRDLDRDRLVRYVLELRRPAVAKRLGFLLEALGHPDARLQWELERVAGRIRHYLPLDPMRPIEGATHNRRWELLVNTDVDRLLQTART